MAGKLEYKNHMVGSNAAYIHKAYDDGGAKKAHREGEKRGIGKRTVQNLISKWKPESEKQPGHSARAATKKSVKKVSAKKAVKKAAPKKAKAPAAKKSKVPKVAPAAKKPPKARPGKVSTDVALNG